jgi:hypothetical protein
VGAAELSSRAGFGRMNGTGVHLLHSLQHVTSIPERRSEVA